MPNRDARFTRNLSDPFFLKKKKKRKIKNWREGVGKSSMELAINVEKKG